MSVHYAKHEREEGESYKTWKWIWPEEHSYDSGWVKMPVPNFISSEDELAKTWFKQSNEEDLKFLRKELEAFFIWHEKEKLEILKHL